MDRSSQTSRRQILIVGGGVFGLSSAWYFLRDGNCKVTVLDVEEPIAPSNDESKFLRIDYTNPERILAVLRSKALWEREEVFSPFFRRTGRIVIYPPDNIATLEGIDQARAQLGLSVRNREPIRLLEDTFGSKRTAEDGEIVYNEDDGVVNWSGAMRKLKEDCIRRGGIFRKERVTQIQPCSQGTINTVITTAGRIDTEQAEVVLAAGPWILPLLEDSSIALPPASRAPIATGIFAFTLELTDQQWNRYNKLPRLSEIGVGIYC